MRWAGAASEAWAQRISSYVKTIVASWAPPLRAPQFYLPQSQVPTGVIDISQVQHGERVDGTYDRLVEVVGGHGEAKLIQYERHESPVTHVS